MIAMRRIFLGLFVVGQLVFLFVGNLLGLLRDASAEKSPPVLLALEHAAPDFVEQDGPLWSMTDALYQASCRYGEITGQPQSWSLFAPTIHRECVFPTLLLSWEDDPVEAPALARTFAVLGADHPLAATSLVAFDRVPEHMIPLDEFVPALMAPKDIHAYFRAGEFRIRRIETRLALTLAAAEGESREEQFERWRQEIHDYVHDYADDILAYMRWRLEQRDPAQPRPKQIMLVMKRYHINDPGAPRGNWTGPYHATVARWQPEVVWNSAYTSIEAFDPVGESFEGVLK